MFDWRQELDMYKTKQYQKFPNGKYYISYNFKKISLII